MLGAGRPQVGLDGAIAHAKELVRCDRGDDTLHDGHVEVVANIVGRAELLVCFFGLLTFLLLYFANKQTKKLFQIFVVVISSFIYLLACLSKESAISLFPILIYWQVRLNNAQEKKPKYWLNIFTIASLFGVLFFYLFARNSILVEKFTISANPNFYYPENPLLTESFSRRFFASLVFLGKYIQLLFFPLFVLSYS